MCKKKNTVAKRCLVFLLLLHCPNLTGAVLMVIAVTAAHVGVSVGVSVIST